MKKLKISVVKESRKAKYSASNGGSFNGVIFKSITWFEEPRFKFMSGKQKKNFVLNILHNLNKTDIECKPDFGKKERVVVNIQSKYDLEDAIFDEKIKMPKHLRSKENRKRGVKKW